MGQVDAVSFSIGVALCALSALCSVLGVNIQKKSHMKNEKLPPEKRQPYVKSPLWWMGMAGVVLGAIFDFASLGFAPQTVVAAFGSATLVINSWTAPFLLGESLERIELAVTFLITCGATMVVMNASHTSKSESLDVIIDRMKESRFIGYMIVIILGCIILGVCFRISEANKKFLTAPENNNKPRKKYSRRLHVVSITALSGVMGAQSLLFAKAVMLILRQSFQSGKASLFAKFETYVILGAMLTCVFGQTHALNAALARFDAVLVLPIFQVFWIICGVIGAGVFYDEFSSMSFNQIVLLNVGFSLISYGIYMLARLHMSHKAKGEYPRKGSLVDMVAGETIQSVNDYLKERLSERVELPLKRRNSTGADWKRQQQPEVVALTEPLQPLEPPKTVPNNIRYTLTDINPISRRFSSIDHFKEPLLDSQI
eukprot:c8074_g1_i2.p1 GENE.c8074_g1_i2~~c8074_g1_i2.p1  ORF type:complete len:428 (+),score=88.76 c8074_g1_i2:35-1318(+)